MLTTIVPILCNERSWICFVFSCTAMTIKHWKLLYKIWKWLQRSLDGKLCRYRISQILNALLIFEPLYYPWIKYEIHESRWDDHQLKQLLIVKQILPVNLFGNVWGTVWRICILMLGCKGFTNFQYDRHVATYFRLVFQSPFHPTCSSECNTLTCRQQAKLLLTALYLITIRFLYEDEEPFQFPKWLPSSFGGGSPN